MLVVSFAGREASAQGLGLIEGEVLQGNAGAAGTSTIARSFINPAHAALLPASSITLSSGLKSQSYYQRYMNFDAHTSKDTGLDGIPLPLFVYKMTPEIGIFGAIVPFSVGQDIEVKDVPIIILEQEQQVDIVGKGTLEFLAALTVGVKLSNSLSVGLFGSYFKARGDIDLLANGSSLASVQANLANGEVKFGFIYAPVRMFRVGLVTSVWRYSSTEVIIDSELAKLAKKEEGATAPAEGGPKSSTSFLNPIRLGIGFRPTNKIEADLDFSYKRSSPKSEFSLVDFKEKEKDVYNTMSVFFGSAFGVGGEGSVLLGYSYQPSDVGPGSRGVDGKSGFGFMDIALGLGDPPSKPQWSMAAGFRKGFGSLIKKTPKSQGYREMQIDGGFAFSETSIGIDEDGEQPGAYLVQTYRFPVTFTYRF